MVLTRLPSLPDPHLCGTVTGQEYHHYNLIVFARRESVPSPHLDRSRSPWDHRAVGALACGFAASSLNVSTALYGVIKHHSNVWSSRRSGFLSCLTWTQKRDISVLFLMSLVIFNIKFLYSLGMGFKRPEVQVLSPRLKKSDLSGFFYCLAQISAFRTAFVRHFDLDLRQWCHLTQLKYLQPFTTFALKRIPHRKLLSRFVSLFPGPLSSVLSFQYLRVQPASLQIGRASCRERV